MPLTLLPSLQLHHHVHRARATQSRDVVSALDADVISGSILVFRWDACSSSQSYTDAIQDLCHRLDPLKDTVCIRLCKPVFEPCKLVLMPAQQLQPDPPPDLQVQSPGLCTELDCAANV